MKGSILNIILSISLIFFLTAIFSFIYFIYFKPSPVSGIDIHFSGLNEVLPLEQYNYKISIKNNSNQKLSNINLKIALTDGAFFVARPNEKESSLFIGDLKPQESYEQNIDLFFVNAGNLKETIKLILNYKIENKNFTFSKEENYSILVKTPPIKVQVLLPSKIFNNQEFQANFNIINLTKQKLNEVKVKIETPNDYLLTSAFPASNNFYWEFPSFDQNEMKNISLIGQLQSEKSSGIFNVQIEFSFQNLLFSLPKEITKINVLPNPIVLNINSSPSSQNVPIGSSIFYEVALENRSQTTLENGELKVIFDELYDFDSLNSGSSHYEPGSGYIKQDERAIYWTPRNKPELTIIKPGDKIRFQFSISLFGSYPILGSKNKNFTSKIRVEFRTPSIPAEVETFGKEYSIFKEDYKKIIGDLSMEHKLVYLDENFEPQGQFPLASNQVTNLIWHLKIKTIGEDFSNIFISTKLPIGVNFTGKVGGDAILDNVKFDPKTGSFSYTISKLPANLGYLEKELDLAFQLIVEVPSNADPETFVIIPGVQYSATGDFTSVQINKYLGGISGKQVFYQ